MNNRQAALLAAASFLGGVDGSEPSDVLRLADTWAKRLNNQDYEQDEEMRELGIRP